MLLVLSLLPLLAVASVACELRILPTIKDFAQLDNTETSITLGWSLSSTGSAPLKYSLLINDLLLQEFLPPNPMHYTVPGLQPCGQYTFNLTATFDEGTSEPANTEGSTEFQTPGGVGELTTDNEVISWSMPSNAACIDHFSFCWTSTTLQKTECEEMKDTSKSVADLTGCDHLTITVRAVGPDGQSGPQSSTEVSTEYGDPGIPVNFNVISLPNFMAELTWDYPLENPACVKRFSITFGPYTNGTRETVSFNPNLRSDEIATLSNLSACTNYQFDVQSVSLNDILSDAATQFMETDYMSPTQIPDLELTPGTDFITVAWGDDLRDACLAFLRICYSNPETAVSNCTFIYNPDLDQNATLEQLEPCLTYNFVIVSVSETGEYGPPSTASTSTLEEAPGAVQQLEVIPASTSSITVFYDRPLINPYCAIEYVLSYINLMDIEQKQYQQSQNMKGSANARHNTDFKDEITGLDACASYQVEVYAKTSSELIGPATSSSATTNSQLPDPPQDPTILEVEQTSMTFTWFAPENRFCADSYEILMDSSFFIKVNSTYEKEIFYTVTDLPTCTTYEEIKVRSYNEQYGNSDVAAVGEMSTLCEV